MRSYLVAALGLSCVAFAAGCSSAAPAGEDVASSSAALTANDQAAYTYFVGKGLTSYQAAGIIGNLDQESGMDPTIAQYGGGPGRGIAQWSTGGRWDTDGNDNVEWYAGQEGESATSLTLQLEFIWYELTTFSGYGLSELRASTNVTDATIAFETYYEGCGECDQSTRISYAETALAAYGSEAPPAGAPYAASYVSQSFPLASTALTMFAGQTIPSYIELKNSGAKAWDTSTHLGTTQPRDRTSAFADSTWLSPSRPSGVTSGTIAPGSSYKFTFDLHAPSTPGTYLEYFNLVEEGVAWFSDSGQGGPADNDLEANIVVVAGVRGSLDSATCDAIAGWAQDQASPATAIFTDLYFDAPAGQTGSGSMRITAGNSRSDLCTAIGSCDHGFSVPVPAGVMDGKAHTVYAYGIAYNGEGPNVILPNSPKTFTCAAPTPPYTDHTGVKRHVVSPASMTAWDFSSVEIDQETDAQVTAYPTGADFPSTPTVVIATGAPAVWVIDGDVRRHVINPASLASWGFAVTTWTAAKVDGYAQGADWPETPFLVQGAGEPAVYILDVAPATPPVDAGVFDAGVTDTDSDAGTTGTVIDGGPSSVKHDAGKPHHSKDDAGADDDGGTGDEAPSAGSASGCAMAPSTSGETSLGWFLAAFFMGLCIRRRSLAAKA